MGGRCLPKEDMKILPGDYGVPKIVGGKSGGGGQINANSEWLSALSGLLKVVWEEERKGRSRVDLGERRVLRQEIWKRCGSSS